LHQNLVHFSLLFDLCHMPYPSHSLDLTCLMISADKYKLWSSSLCMYTRLNTRHKERLRHTYPWKFCN
jgi:SET domain-containing protein